MCVPDTSCGCEVASCFSDVDGLCVVIKCTIEVSWKGGIILTYLCDLTYLLSKRTGSQMAMPVPSVSSVRLYDVCLVSQDHNLLG